MPCWLPTVSELRDRLRQGPEKTRTVNDCIVSSCAFRFAQRLMITLVLVAPISY